jgi:hypothetical protein
MGRIMTVRIQRMLTYDQAMASMRQPDARLVQMHGGRGGGYYVVGHDAGRVEDVVADKIKNHPLVRGGHDGLWPGHHQTWRMVS